MAWTQLHYLPLSVFVLLPSTFIISYVIAILLDHVEVEFPYISDTGTHVPESNFFAQSLNIVSGLVALTIYIRYKQVEQYYRNDLTTESRKIFRINRIALFFGLFSAFGLSVVANFREIELFKIHMIGALMAFGFGSIYCWLQSLLSYSMTPLFNTIAMFRWRTILSVTVTVSFLITCVYGQLSILHFHGQDPTNWKPENGGYKMHIISSVSEWIAALALNFFILSFTKEFQTFTIQTPRVIMIEQFDQFQVSTTSGNEEQNNSTIITGQETFFANMSLGTTPIMH